MLSCAKNKTQICGSKRQLRLSAFVKVIWGQKYDWCNLLRFSSILKKVNFAIKCDKLHAMFFYPIINASCSSENMNAPVPNVSPFQPFSNTVETKQVVLFIAKIAAAYCWWWARKVFNFIFWDLKNRSDFCVSLLCNNKHKAFTSVQMGQGNTKSNEMCDSMQLSVSTIEKRDEKPSVCYDNCVFVTFLLRRSFLSFHPLTVLFTLFLSLQMQAFS